jgi:hypothetical protein
LRVAAFVTGDFTPLAKFLDFINQIWSLIPIHPNKEMSNGEGQRKEVNYTA